MTITTSSNSARTYDSIVTGVYSSGTTLTISSIPQTYTDLKVVVNGIFSSAPNSLGMTANNIVSSSYEVSYLSVHNYMTTTVFGTNSVGKNEINRDIFATQTDSSMHIDILSYTNTAYYKNFIVQVGGGNGVGIASHQFRSTAAITSLTFTSSTMTTNFQVSLYGIKAA